MKSLFGIDGPIIGFLTTVFDLIALSILWCVFSLPLFTMGAASSAMFKVVFKYIRRREGHLFAIFYKEFKEDLKKHILTWIIALIGLIILTVDAFILRGMLLNGKVLGNLYWVMLIIIWVAITWMIYLHAYIALFQGGTKEVFKYSMLMMELHPVKAISVFVIVFLGVEVLLIIPVSVFIIPSLVCYLSSFIIEKVFMKHMRPDDIEKIKGDSQDD